MKRVGLALRMTLGGAVCGGYLGILLGAVSGALYGWYASDLSYGLMGAMVGGATVAVGGAVYGMVAGLDEGRKEAQDMKATPFTLSRINSDSFQEVSSYRDQGSFERAAAEPPAEIHS